MNRRICALGLSTAAVVAACGGCTGDAAPMPDVTIESPATGTEFAPGETVTLVLAFDHFELTDPNLVTDETKAIVAVLGHAAEEHANVQEGHYHVYLDDADGDDEHVTAWTHSVDYTLPEDLTEGAHTLRVNLRDNGHSDLGINAVVQIICVLPQ